MYDSYSSICSMFYSYSSIFSHFYTSIYLFRSLQPHFTNPTLNFIIILSFPILRGNGMSSFSYPFALKSARSFFSNCVACLRHATYTMHARRKNLWERWPSIDLKSNETQIIYDDADACIFFEYLFEADEVSGLLGLIYNPHLYLAEMNFMSYKLVFI